MTFKRPKARINERTITAGNGPYTTAGAVDGSYRTFASFMSVGDTTFATVVEPGVAYWTGIVTYSAANQITLTTVEETNGTFGAGTKEIFAGTLAARSAFPDDISGAIVTGGTSTAYTVTSYRVYDSLTRLNSALIAFTPHATNGASATLNVDGLGAKPLRLSTGVGLETNVLIAGTPYMAVYNSSDAVFYLHGLGGNAYGVPLGGGMIYIGTTAPSSAFAIPIGQALSRTTYASLFALIGTTYGVGDGSTTFNLPDFRGRVIAGLDGGAGRLTVTSGMTGSSLGATGGAEVHTLTAAEMPSHSHTGTTGTESATHTHSYSQGTPGLAKPNGTGTSPFDSSATGATTGTESATHTHSFTTNAFGTDQPHVNVQPTIACNYIIRVL